MRIEPEFVYVVVAGQPLAEKSGNRGDPLGEIVQRRSASCRRTRDTSVLIDFADDCSDLFGRSATLRISKQRGMLTGLR